LHITRTHRSGFLSAPIRMTLNDLECPIRLKVLLVDGTLDVRLLRVSDSTLCIGVARGDGGGGLEAVLGSETSVLWQDRSQTDLGLGLGLAALVLVLVLVSYFWSCFQHCCTRQALCDMIMLKCNEHLYFFRAVSAEKVPNVTGHHITFWHFLHSYFLITNVRVATEEFFVMYSCCCLIGLGLGVGLTILALVLILVLYFWSWSWSWSYSFGLDLGLGLSILVLFPSLLISEVSEEVATQVAKNCRRQQPHSH